MEGKKPATSRLIVKNVPKHYTEERLRETFSKMGSVTDCKLMSRKGKARLFGFIGYKSEAEAGKAKEYFNNTYLDTSRVAVEFAYPQNSPHLPRAWSRFSTDSSAYLLQHRSESQKVTARQTAAKKAEDEKEGAASLEDIAKKKAKYKKFIEYISKKQAAKQSWNDVFKNFVETEEAAAEDAAQSESSAPKPVEKQEPLSLEKTTKGGKITTTKIAKTRKAGVSEVKTHIKFAETKAPLDTTTVVQAQKAAIVQTANADEALVDENRLYVMNLPFETTEYELNEKFGTYGNIEGISIPKMRGTGQGKGYAYVAYTTAESAIDAYAHLDQTVFQVSGTRE
jgi:multiple RNA-binding domain-containing protein 1